MSTNSFDLDLNCLRKMKDIIACSKCKCIAEDPKVITICEHLFCSKCLSDSTCFVCKTKYIACEIIKPDIYTLKLFELAKVIDGRLEKMGYKVKNIDLALLNLHNSVKEHKPEKQCVPEDSYCGYEAINEKPIKVISKHLKRKSALLHYHCERGGKWLQNLIEDGCDINVLDKNNETLLHVAVRKQDVNSVQLLLQRGALVNVYTQDYTTPLHIANKIKNNIEIIRLLLQHGADKNAMDYFGNTPIDINPRKSRQDIFTLTKPLEYLPMQYLYYTSATIIYYYGCEDIIPKKNPNFPMFAFYNYKKKKQTKYQFLFVIGNSIILSELAVLDFLCQGIPIVKEKDMVEYINTKRRFVPELFPEEIRPGLLKSIVSQLEKKPMLFDGMDFFIIDHVNPIAIFGSLYNNIDLEYVIKNFGGHVLTGKPDCKRSSRIKNYPFHSQKCKGMETCRYFLVYEKENPSILMYNEDVIKHVSSEWVIKCAMSYEIFKV